MLILILILKRESAESQLCLIFITGMQFIIKLPVKHALKKGIETTVT
jgi:hypothetical protein